MSKKGDNFFEEHIEKIVLAIVGLVCIWFLIARVVFSPNCVKYDKKKFGPGDIDNHISKQAEPLKAEVDREPEPRDTYEPNAGKFIAKMNSAISDIDISLYPPQPDNLWEVEIQPVYALPWIGEVNEVSVEHIRAVAYVPTEEINRENVYSKSGSEPNDIDLVTVEARFDVAGLYKRFNEGFAGEYVQEEWRDPCLAKPVFAAVQLQRQELGADGNWSEWQIVPRIRIDVRRRMLEVIEDVEELPPGGIEVRLIQFDKPDVRMELLQPEAYRIASAKEEWFPPSLHKKYVEYQRRVEKQEKWEAMEAGRQKREEEHEKKLAEQEREKERKRQEAEKTRSERNVRGTGYGRFGTLAGRTTAKTIKRDTKSDKELSEKRRERMLKEQEKRLARIKEISESISVEDIYDEFDKSLITEKMDFAKTRQPLVFWAHDDTVEPEKSYRYRIRLGVFNPIAGRNQFSEQDKSQRNKVILWSDLSDVTETVGIPGRLYFFPVEVQEATNIVRVQVSKYVLGYWYSENFRGRPGEVIGKVVEFELVEAEEKIMVPETIDYSTEAVLVDIIPVEYWSGGRVLRERYYSDMLYSFDGSNIEHMPVESRHWAKELLAKFIKIKRLEKEQKEPLRGWSDKVGRRRRLGPMQRQRPAIEMPGDIYMKMIQERRKTTERWY